MNSSSTAEHRYDYIDTLPDEILVAILAYLQIKEAARTSVLARRWKSIWKFRSCLHLDGTENTEHRSSLTIEAERRKYINWVNQLLESCMESSTHMEELRITSGLRENHANEIDKWLCFAMAKRVKSLKLDFSSSYILGYYSYYIFKDSLLQLPCNISGFDSLTTLSLTAVIVTGDTVNSILSNCPLLETLTLQDARSLRSLVVNSSSLKLKHLEIKGCLELRAVDISAGNLVSFKYYGSGSLSIDISFGNVPFLSEFLIGGKYVEHWLHQLDKLSYDWSKLQSLTLDLYNMFSSECNSLATKLPEFSNLKHFDLKHSRISEPSLSFVASFLEASPYLCSLTVDVEEHYRPLNLRNYQQVERHASKYLKVIKLVGCIGKETDIDLATGFDSMNSLCTAEYRDDHIDTLPDEILVAILSQLHIKEAARTSVLSRRWKSVWKFRSCLDFDGTENMEHLNFKTDEAARQEYVNWVNQVMESYMESSTVEELIFTFSLRKNHANEIHKWICFAIAKKVKRLKLDFSSLLGKETYWDYAFTLLQLPCNISGLDSLTALTLNAVDVTGDIVTSILSNCPLLEKLTLEDACSLRSLVVNGPSLKLKHLKIKHCFWLRVLEVSAGNLVSFKCSGSLYPSLDISFGNIPLLSEILIGGTYVNHWLHHLDKLSYDWSQLHSLTLDLYHMFSPEDRSFHAKFPEFTNLKRLELKSFRICGPSLAFLASFLEASPCLCSLTVEVEEEEPSRSLKLWSYQSVERHTHKCLKMIKLVDWTGGETDIELATYLLEMSVSLDKIIVVPLHYQNSGYSRTSPSSTEAAKQAAKEGIRKLESKLPVGAVLLIRN